MIPLTPIQQRTYDAFVKLWEAHGRAPTISELGRQTKRSNGSTFELIRQLEKHGAIRRIKGGGHARPYVPAAYPTVSLKSVLKIVKHDDFLTREVASLTVFLIGEPE